MSPDVISEKRASIIARYGEWTDHNVKLADGVYTIGESVGSEKLRRIVQVVQDMCGASMRDLRILDLACLEGQYAIEFAQQGARAVGIEGREASVEKARFVKEVLGLDNLEFHQDDVRNLSKERYGEFDVVLCLGLLYHLDAPDVFKFVDSIAEVCTRFAIFDTHVSFARDRRYEYKGREFWGRDVVEHDPESSSDERMEDLWASLDNITAVWPTFNSLLNMLTIAGFTSVYQCHIPVELKKPSDRLTLVAMKGRPSKIMNMPRLNGMPALELPEILRQKPSIQQRPFYNFSHRIDFLFPRKVRRRIKKVLRSVGLMSSEPAAWERDWKDRHVDRSPDRSQ